MIIFTPLSASARSSTTTTALAYVLQLDDVKILLDCGTPPWNLDSPESRDYLEKLQEVAPSVDLVLFSHGDLAHVGLYPWAHARWKLQAPAYSALPVQSMGRMAVVEDVEAIKAEEDLSPPDTEMEVDGQQPPTHKRVPTMQEIHIAFDSINTLRYSEPTHLGGKCQGITITPFSAGHTLGGTIWKIRSPTSGTIVYAVDMNHMKERHLDGTVILRSMSAASGSGVFEPLARPDVFITDAERTLVVTPRRKDRDSVFLDIINRTLQSSHSVLVPCDASTRILELLVLLDQYWTFQKLSHPICLVSKTGHEMLTIVRSMVEWMGGTMSKDEAPTSLDPNATKTQKQKKRRRDDEDEDATIGPTALQFKHVEFYTSPAALLAAHPQTTPKLILAVPSTLSHGASRHLFTEFVSTPGNALVLTSIGDHGTLSHTLFQKWNEYQAEGNKWGQGKVGQPVTLDETMTVKLNSKVPLEGAELEEYLRKERLAKEKEAAQRAANARAQQRLLEADEGESDDEDESESEGEEDDDALSVERSLAQADINDDPTSSDAIGRRVGATGSTGRSGGGGGMDWMTSSGGAGDQDDPASSRQISFDIYLKGNVSKAAGFFKSSSGQTQRFRMYPYIERKRRVDEYGETLDIGAWLRKGKALEEDAESEEVKEAKRKKMLEDEEKRKKMDPPEPPSKFVTATIDVKVRCWVAYVDLEGLNDGRAVKMIVPQVNPRKMIVVHATSEATDALLQSCASIRSMTQDIFTPGIGESITIGQHTNTFSISLADTLLASLKMSQLEDTEIGFVYGRIVSHANSTIPVLEPASASATTPSAQSGTETEVGESTSAVVPNGPTRAVVSLPRSTLIGDLKLTVLRSRLKSIGIEAEFAGDGVLVCSGGGSGDMEQTVAVKKTGRGKVTVEGSTGDIYFAVRKEVYGLHARVAAV
ncbi:hypothetical protein FRC03_005791 [Tulasnella sp. 419]|nr:hypothetical protein FRC03_005791 [Tulasnella sp. 419]